MDGYEIAKSILVKYSSPDMTETLCSTEDLIKDFGRIIDQQNRRIESIQDYHEAWMRIQN